MHHFTDKEKERIVNYSILETQAILNIGTTHLGLDLKPDQTAIAALTYTEAKRNIAEVTLGIHPDTPFAKAMRQEGHALAAMLSGSPPADPDPTSTSAGYEQLVTPTPDSPSEAIEALVAPLLAYTHALKDGHVYEGILRTYEQHGRQHESGVIFVSPIDILRETFPNRQAAQRFYTIEQEAIRANLNISHLKVALLIGKTAINLENTRTPGDREIETIAARVRTCWFDMAFEH